MKSATSASLPRSSCCASCSRWSSAAWAQQRLIPLRARLIFATHQDLAKLVAEGKFRQDLYYRINVMRIESPPLQERPEDIPADRQPFPRHYAQVFQKPMEAIEPEALEMLQSYSWPGNVRELENVMQRAIIVAPGRTIRTEDLSLNAPGRRGSPSFDDVVDIGDYQPAGSFERQLRDYKIKLAVTAVRENNGNKTLAARSLCISRAYLHRLHPARRDRPAVRRAAVARVGNRLIHKNEPPAAAQCCCAPAPQRNVAARPPGHLSYSSQ